MILIYNTMLRRKEVFRPIDPPNVGLYTCGPTVYNYAHIGNLRAYVFADTLKRILTYFNYQVKHVMNVTDVGHLTDDGDSGEDKMEIGARREKKSPWEIALHYEKAFVHDIKKLNIRLPDVMCRATEHIPEQIDLVRRLEEKGLAYRITDGIYFDVSKVADYGKLARLDVTKLRLRARVAPAEGKHSPADFALWKFSPKDHQRAMEWDSPWGVGFPGWHTECSAMSMKYLGETFDIHTGGIDHIPVHHINEIAQSEMATGKTFVNYWMHVEFLQMGKEKMAKSTGGFMTLGRLLGMGFSPEDYRYLLLTTHYRKPMAFSIEALEGARNAVRNLKQCALDLKQGKRISRREEIQNYVNHFEGAIKDDVNTPRAMAVMWTMVKDSKLPSRLRYDTLVQFDCVLGLGVEGFRPSDTEPIADEIIQKLSERQKARETGDFATADRIRDEVEQAGYRIKDTLSGYKIEMKP